VGKNINMDNFEEVKTDDLFLSGPAAAGHITADFESDEDQESFLPDKATIGGIVLFCAAFSTVLTLIWKYMPDTILPFAKTSLIGFSLITLIRLFLSLLLPIVYFAVRYHIPDTNMLGRYPGMGAMLLSFMIGCPASLIFVSLHNLIVRFFLAKKIFLTLPAFLYVSKDMSIESRFLTLAAAFLIPVLLQELFFRGLFFSVWPRSTAVFLKLLLSAFLFAVFMQNPVDVIPLFLLGLLLAYVRHATDHVLCPVFTQISMLITYYVFSALIPYTDYISGTQADFDAASLYTSIAALVMSLLAFLPVLAQLRRMSHEADRLEPEQTMSWRESLKGQFGWSFGLGLLLFAASWVLLLNI